MCFSQVCENSASINNLPSLIVKRLCTSFHIHVLFAPAGTVKTGKVEVEMDSVGEEVSLWEKMMQYPDSWAEGTLSLRSTMLTGK